MRLEYCDTVFWLDYPLKVCLQGIASRFGKPREDMPWIETQRDEEFMEFVCEFPKVTRPKIAEVLEKIRISISLFFIPGKKQKNILLL